VIKKGISPRWTRVPVYAATSFLWHTQRSFEVLKSLHSVRKRTPFRLHATNPSSTHILYIMPQEAEIAYTPDTRYIPDTPDTRYIPDSSTRYRIYTKYTIPLRFFWRVYIHDKPDICLIPGVYAIHRRKEGRKEGGTSSPQKRGGPRSHPGLPPGTSPEDLRARERGEQGVKQGKGAEAGDGRGIVGGCAVVCPGAAPL
jgi:hypothetical protein